MTKRMRHTLTSLAILSALAPNASAQSGGAPTEPAAPATAEAVTPSRDATPATAPRSNGLEALVPQIAEHPYHLDPGPRPFEHRLSVSPAYGSLGAERLFALRVGYNPNSWLGYEASLGHNPAHSVHAVLHTVSAIVRHPFAGRFQPYATAGYGMMLVFPGQSLNADPVTKNALTAGGGLEIFIRDDLALRGEMRYASVFGRQKDRDGVVNYDYLQQTIGLSFYRSIRP